MNSVSTVIKDEQDKLLQKVSSVSVSVIKDMYLNLYIKSDGRKIFVSEKNN